GQPRRAGEPSLLCSAVVSSVLFVPPPGLRRASVPRRSPRCARRFHRPRQAPHRSHGSTRRRGPGCPPATPCHTGSATPTSPPPCPSRKALVGASESFQELPGSRQSPSLGSFKRTPNQGSFPRPALTGFP